MRRKFSLAHMLLTILPIALCSTLAHAQSGSKTQSGSENKLGSNTKTDSELHASVGQHTGRLVTVNSQQSFDKTYETLKKTLESKDLKIFAEFDHSKSAKMADMTLRPTKVILFGNPEMGVPLMKANQAIALDLPQRMAVYEDAQGKVHIIYNDPQVIAKDHKLAGQDEIIDKISGALKMFANAAATGGSQK